MTAALALVALAVAVLAGTVGLRPGPAAAQAAAAQVQAGADSALTVTAVPRWGRALPGSWTSYLVTLANDGPEEVHGYLELAPEPQPPPADQGLPRGGLQTPAPRGEGQVVALGTRELTVARRPGPRPAPADFPVYRQPVTVPRGGGERRLTVTVMEAPYGYRAELRRSGDGRVLSSSTPLALPSPEGPRYTVALLSRNPGAGDSIEAVASLFGPRRGAVTVLASERDFPDHVMGLAGLHALVIDGFETATLGADQLRALSDYVALGGSLVLAGGADGARNLAALPEGLVPMRLTGRAVASVRALGEEVGSDLAPVATGEARTGRPLLHSDDGVPLIVAADYGSGRILQLAYDPLSEPIVSRPALADRAWSQALVPALDRLDLTSDGRQGAPLGLAPPEQLWSAVLASPGWPPWPRPALWLLGLWSTAAAPAGFALLRSRRRARRFWGVLPVMSAALAAGVGLTGMGREARVLPVVQVSIVGPGEVVATTSYQSVQTLGRKPAIFDLTPDTVEPAAGGGSGARSGNPGPAVSSVFVEPGLLTGRDHVELVHAATGRGGGQVDRTGGVVTMTLPSGPGEVRGVEVATVGRGKGLELDLSMADQPGGPPRVQGLIVNRTDRVVHRLRAQLADGSQARLAERIRPGAEVRVDAAMVAARRAEVGQGPTAEPEEQVLFAAAGSAFTRRGQMVVAGFDGSEPDRRSVLVQVVPAGTGTR